MKFKKTELKKYVGETAVRGIPNRPEKKSFFNIFSIHASYDRFPYGRCYCYRYPHQFGSESGTT